MSQSPGAQCRTSPPFCFCSQFFSPASPWRVSSVPSLRLCLGLCLSVCLSHVSVSPEHSHSRPPPPAVFPCLIVSRPLSVFLFARLSQSVCPVQLSQSLWSLSQFVCLGLSTRLSQPLWSLSLSVRPSLSVSVVSQSVCLTLSLSARLSQSLWSLNLPLSHSLAPASPSVFQHSSLLTSQSGK